MKDKQAYCITINGYLLVEYMRETKRESIRALRLDDSDRMSWNYQKEEGYDCIKVTVSPIKNNKPKKK